MKAWWSNVPQVSQPVGRWWWCSVANLCLILCDPPDCSMTVLSFTIFWSLPKLMLLSWWCHPTISSFVSPFSSCLQSFPASGSFPMSWLFTSGSQSIGVSASASVLPMNIQDWFPLGWTGWISLQSKGPLYGPSLTSIQDYWKNNSFDCFTLLAKWCLCFLTHCQGRWWSWAEIRLGF